MKKTILITKIAVYVLIVIAACFIGKHFITPDYPEHVKAWIFAYVVGTIGYSLRDYSWFIMKRRRTSTTLITIILLAFSAMIAFIGLFGKGSTTADAAAGIGLIVFLFTAAGVFTELFLIKAYKRTISKYGLLLIIVGLLACTAAKAQEQTYNYDLRLSNTRPGAAYEFFFNHVKQFKKIADDDQMNVRITSRGEQARIVIEVSLEDHESLTITRDVEPGVTDIQLEDMRPYYLYTPYEPYAFTSEQAGYLIEEEFFTRTVKGMPYHYYHAKYTCLRGEESISHNYTFYQKKGMWRIKHYVYLWHDGPLVGTEENLPKGFWDTWAEIDYEEPLENITPLDPESLVGHFRKKCFADQVCFERRTEVKIQKYRLEGLPERSLWISYANR